MTFASVLFLSFAVFACSSPDSESSPSATKKLDLPAGWEGATSITRLTQSGCLSSAYGNVPEAVSVAPAPGEITVQFLQGAFRCNQKVVGYEQRPAPDRIRVLVQPEDTSAPTNCDCRYNVSIRLENVSSGDCAVTLYRRSESSNDVVLIGEKIAAVP